MKQMINTSPSLFFTLLLLLNTLFLLSLNTYIMCISNIAYRCTYVNHFKTRPQSAFKLFIQPTDPHTYYSRITIRRAHHLAVHPAPFAKSCLRHFPAAMQLTLLMRWRSPRQKKAVTHTHDSLPNFLFHFINLSSQEASLRRIS